MAACARREAASVPIASQQEELVDVIIVTPTKIRTLVPTIVRFSPTATPSSASGVSLRQVDPADCGAALERHYSLASDHCLEGPTGYFCNGGGPPRIQPQSGALAERGGLAEAEAIDSLHSSALGATGGGLVWLRLEENIRMDALLVGDVRIRNLVAPGSALVKWRSLTVESASATADCPEAPATGALVVQGLYGQSANLAINGVSATINGTLIALTAGNVTRFIVIEGQAL